MKKGRLLCEPTLDAVVSYSRARSFPQRSLFFEYYDYFFCPKIKSKLLPRPGGADRRRRHFETPRPSCPETDAGCRRVPAPRCPATTGSRMTRCATKKKLLRKMLDNLVRIPGMATLESEIAVISGSRRESRDPGRGRFQGQPRRLPTEMPQILSSGFSAFLRTIRSTFHRGTMRPTCGCVEFYRFGRVSSCRWERFSNIPRRTANDDSPKRDRRKMAPTCFDGRLT